MCSDIKKNIYLRTSHQSLFYFPHCSRSWLGLWKFTEGLKHNTWDISHFSLVFYGLKGTKYICNKPRIREICNYKI